MLVFKKILKQFLSLIKIESNFETKWYLSSVSSRFCNNCRINCLDVNICWRDVFWHSDFIVTTRFKNLLVNWNKLIDILTYPNAILICKIMIFKKMSFTFIERLCKLFLSWNFLKLIGQLQISTNMRFYWKQYSLFFRRFDDVFWTIFDLWNELKKIFSKFIEQFFMFLIFCIERSEVHWIVFFHNMLWRLHWIVFLHNILWRTKKGKLPTTWRFLNTIVMKWLKISFRWRLWNISKVLFSLNCFASQGHRSMYRYFFCFKNK